MKGTDSTLLNARQVGVAALLLNLVVCAAVHLAHGISLGILDPTAWLGGSPSTGSGHRFALPGEIPKVLYHSLTILPLLTVLACFFAFLAFRAHAHSESTSLRQVLNQYLTPRRFWACVAFLVMTFPWGHRIKSHQWVSQPWMWLFYRWFLLTLVLVQLGFLIRLFRHGSSAVRNDSRHSAFRIPHSAFRTPHSAFRIPHSAFRILSSDVVFVLLAMAVVFLETNIVSWKVLEHVAHVQDAIAQLFQAKIFTLGRWYLDPPPVPDAFRYPHVILEERWYGIYPPGFALMLALGVLIGMPWLVNPVLSTLAVPALFVYGRRLYGSTVARLAVVLLCLSPFFLGMGSSMMNHSLALVVLMMLALALEHAKKRWTGFVVGGFLSGYAFIVRPLTALGVGIPLVVFFLFEGRARPGRLFRGAVLFLIGLLPCAALMLVANAKTTGNPLVSGYDVYFDGNPIGFGHRPWGKHPAGFVSSHQVYHTPQLGLANWSINLNDANRDLFGWPIAGLFPLVYLWLGRQSPSYQDRKILWVCAGLGIAYIFYYYQDLCYGPRNIYECLPYGLLLVSRGLLSLREDVGTALKLTHRQLVVVSLVALICLECITAVTTVPRLVSYYRRNYWLVTGDLRALVQKADLGRAVVFVNPGLNYGNGFQLNPPDMVSGALFVEDLGPDIRTEAAAAYPDRPAYYAVVERIEDGRPIPRLTSEPPEED